LHSAWMSLSGRYFRGEDESIPVRWLVANARQSAAWLAVKQRRGAVTLTVNVMRVRGERYTVHIKGDSGQRFTNQGCLLCNYNDNITRPTTTTTTTTTNTTTAATTTTTTTTLRGGP